MRARLLGLLLAGAAFLGLSQSAVAADRWGGIYIGGSLGYQWTDYTSTLAGFPGDNVNDVHDSGLGGIHVGVQHQFGQLVVGLEGSYSGTGAFSGFSGGTTSPTADCLGVSGTFIPFTCQARLNSVFMLGPRLGWTPNDQWLLFVTGGWANGHLSDRVLANGVVVGSTSRTHDGWFWGGGVEYALTSTWSVGLEYTHIDFATGFHCEQTVPGGCATGESRNASADTDIVRARLTLTLGRP